MNPFYLVVALGTGAAIAVQALANSRLRVALGTPVWAAIAQFIVGLAALVVIALLTRQPAPDTGGLSRMPWWGWVGGAVGALFIVVSIVLTPRLGTALTLATITVGQLLAALVLDHYGLLGAPVVRLSLPRALGAACLLAGIALMRFK
ncbi:MAG TPA: DMT family transporter [Vicinamibacterales bacterium]|nr:DMT family transporter [Vicinamibacterales bacterium]